MFAIYINLYYSLIISVLLSISVENLHIYSLSNIKFKFKNYLLIKQVIFPGIAVDNRQNVYICDPKNHRVIKVYR